MQGPVNDVAAALPAYEIGEELGRGAWGVVLAARHRRLGREVAIKQLPREFASDPDVRARFLAEGQRLASLDHPHIVPVYDYVEHAETCLLVMERLHGGTVAGLAAGKRLEPPVACGLALAACAALHHAHDRGLLHRDVKPENMLFAASGALKVADFGIAKVLGGAATAATAEGMMLGTPAFMAPEQIQGGELTPATDVYALGTTLYLLLAGRLPFPVDGEVASFLFRRVHEEPCPLSEAASELPPRLCEVIDAALARDPGDRIASAQDLGIGIAGAAAQAWGPGWLDAAGVVLASAGPIADAARNAAAAGHETVVSTPKGAALAQARELYETGSYGAALETLSAADQAAPLQPEDLERLATCAYMLGGFEDYCKAMERAHQAYVEAGDSRRAAQCAVWLAVHLFAGGEVGRAGGWLGRAQRLIEQEEGELAVHGYLLFPRSFQERGKGNHADAARISREAAAIGERHGDMDLVALGLMHTGTCLVGDGAIAEGLRALDEAMVATGTGELSPVVSGLVYCGVVLACQEAHDVRRAREWTRALTAWCDARPDMIAFTGRCRLHRAELMQLEGAWPEAVEEAERAQVRSEQADNKRSAGAAAYVRGEVLRLRGDFGAAEESFRDASRLGFDPQPGLALLWHARGEPDAAVGATRRAIGEATDLATRLRLLPAHVEVMLASNDLEAARTAAGELEAIASGHEEGMLGAVAAQARGRVALAEGDAGSAIVRLRSALAIWQDLGAKYEEARTHALIGTACRALGDERSAALELDAARDAFERLGAAPDLEGVAQRLGDPVERGRELYESGTWRGAFETLAAADRSAALETADLERMARAAYMLGRDDDYVDGLERAHRAYLESGDPLRAVRCAFWIGHNAMFRGNVTLGRGWMERAQRLLEGVQGDCAERGYLLIPAWLQQMGAGDFDAGYATAAQAAELGERFGDADLVWLARMDQGRALVKQGRAQDGLRLVDEALVAATGGELSPIVTGIVYCNTIVFCRDAYELRHAHAWTEALTRWCERQPEMVAHNGLCLVHRAEMIQLKGGWEAALEEAELVTKRFTQGVLNERALGTALYRQGEVHRLRGEMGGAEDAYREASRHGFEPQPGLALLRLAQGKCDAAAAAIRRAVMEATDPLSRAGLLPAHVEITLAVGDVESARGACGELEEIAERQGSEALAAMAAHARGAVAVAGGDAAGALVTLRAAFRAWQALEAPYEAARARELLGLACRALGDEDSAELELDAAREVYERLGAAPDLARIEAPTR